MTLRFLILSSPFLISCSLFATTVPTVTTPPEFIRSCLELLRTAFHPTKQSPTTEIKFNLRDVLGTNPPKIIRWMEKMGITPPPMRSARKLYRAITESASEDTDLVVHMLQVLDIKVIVHGLENIPGEGPIAMLSNHPTGVIDGAVLAHILGMRGRNEYWITALRMLDQVFEGDKRLSDRFLYFDRADTTDAHEYNTRTFRQILNGKRDGRAVIMFPAGSIARKSPADLNLPKDAPWDETAVTLARTMGVFVPVRIHTENSWFYYFFNTLSPVLRRTLYFKEALWKRGQEIHVVVGKPVPWSELNDYGNRFPASERKQAQLDHMRAIVESLEIPQ